MLRLQMRKLVCVFTVLKAWRRAFSWQGPIFCPCIFTSPYCIESEQEEWKRINQTHQWSICCLGFVNVQKSWWPVPITKCFHGWEFSGLFLNSGFWGWQKVSLKMLNLADYNGISQLLSISLKTSDNLNWKYWYFVGIMQVLTFECLKFRIFESLNFHPCASHKGR